MWGAVTIEPAYIDYFSAIRHSDPEAAGGERYRVLREILQGEIEARYQLELSELHPAGRQFLKAAAQLIPAIEELEAAITSGEVSGLVGLGNAVFRHSATAARECDTLMQQAQRMHDMAAGVLTTLIPGDLFNLDKLGTFPSHHDG